MSLKVTVYNKEPGVFVISAVGSIDSNTYLDLEKSIASVINPSVKAIIFDMKGVTFISSLGLSVIFKTKRYLEENRATLLITNLQPQIQKVFELVKVVPESLFASMEDADEYLDKFLADLEKE